MKNLKELQTGDLVRKTFQTNVDKAGQIEVVDRAIWVTASAEMPDRDDDVIHQIRSEKGKGWQFSQYDPNPVIMAFHDYRQPPIGESVSRKLVKADKSKSGTNELWMRPRFTENQVGDFFLEQYLSGNMKAWSVGFMPTKWEYRYKDDKSEEEADGWPIGYYFYEQELWELSAVPIPSNPAALTHLKSAFKSKFGEDLEKAMPVFDGVITQGAMMLRGGLSSVKALATPSDSSEPSTVLYELKNADVPFRIVLGTLKSSTPETIVEAEDDEEKEVFLGRWQEKGQPSTDSVESAEDGDARVIIDSKGRAIKAGPLPLVDATELGAVEEVLEEMTEITASGEIDQGVLYSIIDSVQMMSVDGGETWTLVKDEEVSQEEEANGGTAVADPEPTPAIAESESGGDNVAESNEMTDEQVEQISEIFLPIVSNLLELVGVSEGSTEENEE